jgi:hypothetical protein
MHLADESGTVEVLDASKEVGADILAVTRIKGPRRIERYWQGRAPLSVF